MMRKFIFLLTKYKKLLAMPFMSIYDLALKLSTADGHRAIISLRKDDFRFLF